MTNGAAPAAAPAGGRGKTKMTAGILGILLGGLGVHHFYLGSWQSGVLIIVLSCCTGVGGLLGVVEGVLLLTMKDEDFEKKYNQREPEKFEFVFQKKG